MPRFLAELPRPTAGSSPPGWADKTDEQLVKKPVYRRAWFLQLMLVLLLAAVAAGIAGGLLLLRWHRTQQADLARQRRGVEAFVRSAAFTTFAREVDAQFVATLNLVTLRPGPVSRLLPDLAAAEKARHEVPWTLELLPLPVFVKDHPGRVRAAIRTATDLLAQRGFAFDENRIADARRTFLRLLAPHARTFLAGQPGADFPALFLDRRMQDVVLAAYAAHAGGTREEAERAFVFYTLVGPLLWQQLDGLRTGSK